MKKIAAACSVLMLFGCGGDAAAPGVVGDGSTPDSTDGAASGPDGGAADSAGTPADAPMGSEMLDDSGKVQLGGMDGITGTSMGKVYNATLNPKVTDYGTEYKVLLLEAKSMGGGDGWTITIPKTPGLYPCGKNGDPNPGTFALVGGPPPLGTAYGVPGSSCTVEVKSTVGHIEGRFVGVLVGLAGGQYPVTSGYFYFSKGLTDCASAKDPGVPAGMTGATLAVTGLKGSASVYFCGENASYKSQSSNPYEPSLTFFGHANDRDITLTIEGIYAMGTFPCGMPGNGMPDGRHVKVSLGEFSFIEQSAMNGGSCTVTVTLYDGANIAGTYQGTLWNSYTTEHSELTVEGSFRTPRMLKPQ